MAEKESQELVGKLRKEKGSEKTVKEQIQMAKIQIAMMKRLQANRFSMDEF